MAGCGLDEVPHKRQTWPQKFSSVQFSSVTQSYPTLCDPMDYSMPGLPVHHQLPQLTQTYVHWVTDGIQPSHPLSSPFPSAFNLIQHQDLFKWFSSLHKVAKVLEFQLQHQPFQWIFRTDLNLIWNHLLLDINMHEHTPVRHTQLIVSTTSLHLILVTHCGRLGNMPLRCQLAVGTWAIYLPIHAQFPYL